MRFIHIGLEEDAAKEVAVDLDPNETSKAIEAVKNKDSTEPVKVLQVANYKEEIAALRAKNKTENAGESVDDKPNNVDDSGATDTDIPSGIDSTTGSSVPGDDGTGDGPSVDTDSSVPVEQTPGTAELGKDAPGKSDTEVAQENFIVQGHKMALEALDSMQEMSRYLDMIKRRSKLGGISSPTARIILDALENHSLRCGYNFDKTQVPSLESYESYSGADQSTRELSVAIEGFLSTTWEAIKKFFKSIWKWIMDILNGKNNGAPGTVARPQTKPTREAAIKDLENKLDGLKSKLKNAEKLDEKSKEKLPKAIAKALFRTKDKGTLKEAYNNGEVLASVADSFSMLAKFFEKESQSFSAGIILGKSTGLRSMMASKDNLGSIELGTLELPPNGYQLLAEYPTEEITNGIHARFVLSGPNKELYQITNAQATSLLGKQGLTFVSDKKEQNDISVPELDDNGIANLILIVNEIKKCYASINNSQAVLNAWAKTIKKYSEDDTPPTWLGLDDKVVTDLKAQTMLIGALEVSMAAGYMKLENQVNVYKNGIDKLVAIYSK